MQNPGVRIYEYRLSLGMSQAELAGRAGLAQANLSNIEKGKRDLTVSTLLRIASALEVKPSRLIDADEGEPGLTLTRDRIEKLAALVLTPEARAPRELNEFACLFRQILPEAGPRASVKKTSLAWVKLRQRLSAAEIKGVLDRVEDARQREYAEKAD